MKASRRGTLRTIDWQETHARLGRAAEATHEALRPSPERAKAIMDERAKALGRVPPRAPGAAEVLEVATFTLADERYAVETHFIRRVVRMSDHTPVPGAPDFLVGVINLRGEILAVIDLRKPFGVATVAPTDQSRIVVLGVERDEFGVLADAVHEVTMLRTDEVLEPPGSTTAAGRQYLRGVMGDATIVLDGAALLQDARFVVDQGEDTGA